eukprot:1264590-Ditylum_brightwellii.AAC.1
MFHFVTSDSGGEHRGIQIRRRESQECVEGTKGGLGELDRKKQAHVMSITEGHILHYTYKVYVTQPTSSEGNGLTTTGKSQKQQGSAPLPFFDHDFASYHTTEWFRWELNVQLLAKGASQLHAANEVRNKFKALLIKLLATHGKDTINVFSETHCRLEVENFPKTARE